MDQHDDVCQAVEVIETTAGDNGLVDVYKSNLNGTLRDHMDNFRTYFSAGPPAKLLKLNVGLTPIEKAVIIRLRKYFP